MEDPYRPAIEEQVPAGRVLAGPNRWRTALHLLITSGLLGVGAWALTTTLGARLALALGALMLAIAGDFVRTIHEALLPHRVVVDSRGLELCWARKRPWRPWMARTSVAIPWDDLTGIRTSTTNINGTVTTDLLLDRLGGGIVEVPHGTFDVDASELQAALLDELDQRLRAPRRAAADVAGYCRARYAAEPVDLELRVKLAPVLGLAVLTVILVLVPGAIALAIGGWFPHLVLTGPGLLVIGIVSFALWTSRSPRRLRLSGEGFGYGPGPGRLVVVPWSELRFARLHLSNGEAVAVRVATRGGQDVTLRGDYGVSLRELAVMISPPVDEVERAREQQRGVST